MRKILIFNDGVTIGGAEILLMDILNHLSQKECEITLLLPYPSTDTTLIDRIPKSVGVEYLYTQKPNKFKHILYINLMTLFPQIYIRLVDLKKAMHYDLVVCFKNSFYSVAFSKIKRPKYVWVHSQPYVREYQTNSFRSFISNKLNRMHIQSMYNSFKQFDEVFCVSNMCKEEFLKAYTNDTPPNNVTVMYNAMNLSQIAQKANEQLSLQKMDTPTFIVAHRFSPEKKIDRMIDVSKRLLSEGYKFHIFILGKGTEFAYIQQLVNENKLDETITLLGYLENPYPYFKLSDWLVVCSSIESFSLVLLEATLLDTPIITTDCGGPVDVIENGKYGILIENSIEGVYLGMKKVLDDPQLWTYYNSKKEECLARFDYPTWLSKIDKIFGC